MEHLPRVCVVRLLGSQVLALDLSVFSLKYIHQTNIE